MNQQQQQQQQQEQTSSGLTRYKSAPSSYFTGLFTSDDGFGGDFENIFNTRASSPETNRVFASFMDSVDTVDQNCSSNMSIQSQSQSQFLQSVKHEAIDQQLQRHGSNDFSSASHMIYQSQPQQGYNSEAATSAMDDSYGRSSSSINSDRVNQMKFNGGSTNLIRHSSSPAGFFSNINIENEFDVMRGVGDFGDGISTNAEPRTFSFKSPMNFSSGHPSSSETMNPMDEMRCKTSPRKRHLEEDGNKNGGYITSFPAITRWDDDNKMFSNVSNNQNTDDQIRGTIPLSHHLSLPKNSALLSDMSFQDSVPCKIRAKRGFATHPRSIAERVRRTRISERIRKLQELVPNMDKQTSTSEMLDLAVDYIKDLQMQLKMLSDNRAKCTCST